MRTSPPRPSNRPPLSRRTERLGRAAAALNPVRRSSPCPSGSSGTGRSSSICSVQESCGRRHLADGLWTHLPAGAARREGFRSGGDHQLRERCRIRRSTRTISSPPDVHRSGRHRSSARKPHKYPTSFPVRTENSTDAPVRQTRGRDTRVDQGCDEMAGSSEPSTALTPTTTLAARSAMSGIVGAGRHHERDSSFTTSTEHRSTWRHPSGKWRVWRLRCPGATTPGERWRTCPAPSFRGCTPGTVGVEL